MSELSPRTRYERLLRNPDAPRGYVVLGALTILVGWMVASVIILVYFWRSSRQRPFLYAHTG